MEGKRTRVRCEQRRCVPLLRENTPARADGIKQQADPGKVNSAALCFAICYALLLQLKLLTVIKKKNKGSKSSRLNNKW